MSRSVTFGSHARETTSTTIEDDESVSDLLDALESAECRAILEATSDEALTAEEVADRCDLPLSTAYRKLDVLSAAELLEERTRISSSGHHPSEYACSFDAVRLSMGEGGDLALEIEGHTIADRDRGHVPEP